MQHGYRQGDVSSPIIFNLFIQELSTFLNENCPGIFITDAISPVRCILYADDVAHYLETVNNLQVQLNKLSEFCKEYKLSVNMKKTEIIVFRNGGPLRSSEKCRFEGSNVKTTPVYNYMVLLFTPKLSWSAAKYKLVAQAKNVIYSITSYQRNFRHFPYTEYFKLFDTMFLIMGQKFGELIIQIS